MEVPPPKEPEKLDTDVEVQTSKDTIMRLARRRDDASYEQLFSQPSSSFQGGGPAMVEPDRRGFRPSSVTYLAVENEALLDKDTDAHRSMSSREAVCDIVGSDAPLILETHAAASAALRTDIAAMKKSKGKQTEVWVCEGPECGATLTGKRSQGWYRQRQKQVDTQYYCADCWNRSNLVR